MFKKDDNGIIDLRTKGKKAFHEEDEPEFMISHVEEEPEFFKGPEVRPAARPEIAVNRPMEWPAATAVHERPEIIRPAMPMAAPNPHEPGEKVKVKLGKFLDMITRAENDDFFQEHENQEIILNTEFLADLASMGDGKKDKKWFLIFIGGIILGLVVAYFLFKK